MPSKNTLIAVGVGVLIGVILAPKLTSLPILNQLPSV